MRKSITALSCMGGYPENKGQRFLPGSRKWTALLLLLHQLMDEFEKKILRI
jgi:anti-sigma regulatory factor (Ser/Thr protein kinase)